LLVFGDSLSDSGNAYRLTDGALPDAAYYHDGRFSDGLIWVDHLAARQNYYADLLLGRPIEGSVGALNFAVAGAASGNQQLDASTMAAPGLVTQVRSYLDYAASSARPAERSSAMIWVGGNDYAARATEPGEVPSGHTAFVRGVVGNIGGAVNSLSSAGVKDVTLLNLFAFSRTPSSQALLPEVQAAGDALVAEHNAELLSLAARANGAGGTRVVLVDVHRLIESIAANPAAYGFTTVDRPCLVDGASPECVSSAEARGRLFWDGTHLSSAGQELVYETIVGTRGAAIEGPRQAAVVAEAGLDLMNGHRQMLDTYLRNAVTGTDGLFSFALLAESGHHRRGAVEGRTAYAGSDQTFGGGFDYAVFPGMRLGMLLTRGTTDSSLADKAGSIDGSSITGSVFARLDTGTTTLTTHTGHGWLEFDGDRTTNFSPAPVARFVTKAPAWFVDAAVNHPIAFGQTIVDPMIGGRWTRLDFAGWRERDGGLMNIETDAQTRQSAVGRIGVRVGRPFEFNSVSFLPTIELGYERELLNGWTSAVTLQSGQRFETQATAGGRDRMTLDAGLSARFAGALEANLLYRAYVGGTDDQYHKISGGLSLRF
jgi:outer membrane lipase/esterase